MRLFDILNEMDGEEQDGGDKRIRAQYDIAIQSANPQDVVNALSSPKNYGIYAQTFRDPKRVEAVFGPSNPNQKLAAALKQWAGLDEDEKETKVQDIAKRYPEAFEKAKEEWETAGGEGDFTEHLITTDLQLPKTLLGPKGTHYFPIKTPDNLKKYAGNLEKDVHYVVTQDGVTFPSRMENPFKSKQYLKKVLSTIIDNASIDAKVVDLETRPGEETKVVAAKPTTPALTTTLETKEDAFDLRKELQKRFTIPSAVYKVEPIEDPETGETSAKLVITGLTASQRAQLQQFTTDYKYNLEEGLRRMKVRAGIIK